MTSKQLGRLGTFYLEEAVLDVLLESRIQGEEYIGANKISRRAGLYPGGLGTSKENAHWLCTSILDRLIDFDRIKAHKQPGNVNISGYSLSEREYEQRKPNDFSQ